MRVLCSNIEVGYRRCGHTGLAGRYFNEVDDAMGAWVSREDGGRQCRHPYIGATGFGGRQGRHKHRQCADINRGARGRIPPTIRQVRDGQTRHIGVLGLTALASSMGWLSEFRDPSSRTMVETRSDGSILVKVVNTNMGDAAGGAGQVIKPGGRRRQQGVAPRRFMISRQRVRAHMSWC